MKKSFDIAKYLKEHTITAGIVDAKKAWLNESEDDKYTHIGYGHYKLKGKEKDPNATVFSKEGNKYVPTKKDDAAGGKSKSEPAKPKVNIFDKPKEKTSKPTKPKVSAPKVSPKFKDLEKFVQMASTAKDGMDFINQARKDTNVPRETSQKFNNMYGHLSMNKAADQFVADVKNGDFYENDRDRAEKTYKPTFKKDAVVYNKNTNSVGIVRMSDDTYGEVRTDADGMVDIDALEPYNPMKYKHQSTAQVAPSTKQEIEKRKLFQPFKQDEPGLSNNVASTKLKTLMPKSNPKTFSGQSDIDKVSPKQKREISMKIDELDRISKEARAKGEQAPNFNLCKITVPGTNLYCDQNLGVPREEMPQFKGKPQPGSPASKMKVDAGGEVDTEPLFKKMLAKKGIKTYNTEIPSDALKATQSELVGAKVAGMTKALEQNPTHPGITAPIYVSRDGYVIDGHHRWAAVTSMAISQGKPANMKVIVIDDDARNIIPMANKFAQEIGVAAKKADVNQESPSKPVRKGDPKFNKFTQSLAKKAGITPQKLGKEKYQKTMMQAAVAALTDSNYHDAARKLVAKLENRPEFEKDPTTRKDYVSYGKPGYDDFRKTTAWSSEYFDADDTTDEFATTISTQSGWSGDTTIDAIASDLRQNGFNELASKLQSIVENKKSTSLMRIMKETKNK
jgi:hypothetical protein